MRARKLIVAGAAMAAGLMLFSVPAQVVQPIPTVAADSQYNIHGITRSMAVQWAWWHFYTANNGVHNDIKINNQTFFARSNWTKHHKRIIVWIYRRGTGHNEIGRAHV